MDEQQDQDARREADALRRDREKAERLARREAEKAQKDREKAARDSERDEARRRQDAERRERDLAKAEQNILRERERAEQEQVKEAERRKNERERAARDAAREAGRALREAEKAQRAAALAQQRAAREAENARRQAQRAEQDGAPPVQPTDLSRLPADVAVLWRTPEPARRGPRPGLTLEQIADAAIALADAEGIGAVSMARLAESLGFTTMSLYRYVASKDEVLALMTDRAGGRAPSVGPEVGDWRARLELLVALSQPVLRAHPWMAQTTSVLHTLGPNRLTWMEAMLAALDDVPLTEAEKLLAVGALSSHMLEELRLVAAMTERARATTDEVAAMGDVIRMLADRGTHPALLRAVDGGAFDEAPVADDEETLGFGTVLLLDGIEQLIARASSHPQPAALPPGSPDAAEILAVSDRPGTLTS
ncbi:hypothetical protein Cch01nite_15570 [Cellulomonas chitinilytica]|uniref:HTH tetR-type domain-containing protein n=1 Tax=Cellulomonas chitinilytica TaxID=398759 RepID=A0A919P2S4_9CELL|nr:TetR/AcrR family transcriptional regulator C-terminal domain-containing protein [Cellulomonas chitinilytica]GIG20833.1 hypothetical protein Cch01nite_15570 [Cellulomonas chitinilytica]